MVSHLRFGSVIFSTLGRLLLHYLIHFVSPDEIKKEAVLKCELEGACLDLCNTELVLAKDSISSTFIMDIATGKMTKEICSEESGQCVESVTPIFVEPTLISICHNTSGKILLYDTRASKPINHLNGK